MDVFYYVPLILYIITSINCILFFYNLYPSKMIQETQKYATLDCKKVKKTQTVALNLFNDKYEKQDYF